MRIVPNESFGVQPLGVEAHENLAAELEELRGKLDQLGRRFATPAAQASSAIVHLVIRARAVRLQLFDDGLFTDPAWDMLLHLYAHELDHQRVAVSNLGEASLVPQTTALRHMKILELRGLITRRPDELDGRRVWVELSSSGSAAMLRYFQWLSAAA